jgi:hypothetical protein
MKTWADYAMDLEPLDDFFKSNGRDYGDDGGPEVRHSIKRETCCMGN